MSDDTLSSGGGWYSLLLSLSCAVDRTIDPGSLLDVNEIRSVGPSFSSSLCFNFLNIVVSEGRRSKVPRATPLPSMATSTKFPRLDPAPPAATLVVDLRSDTVTTPTKEMREAMCNAEVGDDVMAEDPTVNLLEEKAALLLGKERALFVPSGTMGNLLCVMTHCSRRGDEVLLGDKCHITTYEQGGVASIGGVHPRMVKTLEDGTLDLMDLESKVMPDDIHAPSSKLVCVENTHNLMGGRVLDSVYMSSLAQLANKYGLKIHVDGARIFNAATALHVPVASLLVHADSVSCCLSKGLGAPVGSIIAGSGHFIQKARRLRKSLGGGMRQVGILAAAGIIALEKMSLRLQVDHDNAKQLALGLAAMKSLGININPESVQTNIVYFSVTNLQVSAAQLVEALTDSSDGVVVKMLVVKGNVVRAVMHHQVSQQGVALCLKKIKKILMVTLSC